MAALHEVLGAFEVFARQHGGRAIRSCRQFDPGGVREPGRGGALRRRAAAAPGPAAHHADGGGSAGTADGREPRRCHRGRRQCLRRRGKHGGAPAGPCGRRRAGRLTFRLRAPSGQDRPALRAYGRPQAAQSGVPCACLSRRYRHRIQARLAALAPQLRRCSGVCCRSPPWPVACIWPTRGHRRRSSGPCRRWPLRCPPRPRSR